MDGLDVVTGSVPVDHTERGTAYGQSGFRNSQCNVSGKTGRIISRDKEKKWKMVETKSQWETGFFV